MLYSKVFKYIAAHSPPLSMVEQVLRVLLLFVVKVMLLIVLLQLRDICRRLCGNVGTLVDWGLPPLSEWLGDPACDSSSSCLSEAYTLADHMDWVFSMSRTVSLDQETMACEVVHVFQYA
jgi:hypothetical protein